MKQRGYTVRVEEGRVSVEHRASFRPRTLVWLGIAYFCYCLLPPIRKTFVDFYQHRDPVFAGFALLFLLIPFMSGGTWLFFASGEVMCCDANELRFARRRTLGRWHRLRFPAGQVRGLERASRGGGRNRIYSVLTFQVEGKRYDMLEDLSPTDSDHILKACKAMGLDAIIVVDEGSAMLRDIEKRGWFIKDSPSVFVTLWGIPFIAMGQYMIWGRFLYTAWKKGRTHYAVTTKRVLIVTSGATRKVVSGYLRTLDSVTLTTRQDGIGTVEFSPEPEPESSFWNSRRRRGGPQLDINLSRLAFYDVPDVRRVYGVIQAERNAAQDRSLLVD